MYTWKKGDTITGKINDKEYNIKIVAKTEERPNGVENLYNTNAYLAFTQFFYQIKKLVSKKSNSVFLTQNNKVRAAINFIEKGIKEEFIKEVCK